MRNTPTTCHPKILAAMPGTMKQFVERSGLCRTVVDRYVVALHNQNGCHISSWVVPEGGGRYGAVYTLGDGVDAQKPEPPEKPAGGKTGKPRQRKASEFTLIERRARKLGLANADVMSKTRDPLVAALFGAAA